MAISVLYVDDEEFNLVGFKSSFRRDFQVHTANSAKKGLEILEKEEIQVVLSDQRMPEMTGVEFFEEVRAKYPFAVRILVTGYTDMNALVEAVNKGNIYKYINKPWNNDHLKKVIEAAYDLYQARKNESEDKNKLARANEQLEYMLRQKLLS